MNKIVSIYPLAALLVAAQLSALPQSAMAFGILLVGIYFLVMRYNKIVIFITLVYFFAVPLLLEPVLIALLPRATTLPGYLLPAWLSVLLIIPMFPLLISSLKEQTMALVTIDTVKQDGEPGCAVLSGNNDPRNVLEHINRRELSLTAKSLIAAMASTIVASILIGNLNMAIVGIMLSLFLIGILIYILKNMPLLSLAVEQVEIKLIAGNKTTLPVKIVRNTKFPLHIFINSSCPWFHSDRGSIMSLGSEVKINFTINPSLSGPSLPWFEVLSTDQWGLLKTRQKIEPLKLYVIPRARYAEWLARKYLEETGPWPETQSLTDIPISIKMMYTHGVEYNTSQLYQPGDCMRDIDWKHSKKIGQIVVKKYTEDTRGMAIIVANLTGADADEADKLVYDLITSALTLARAIIPTSIAAYNQERVLAATSYLGPRNLVIKALELGQQVVLVTPVKRYLHPTDIRQLRISLKQLEGKTMEAVKKLRNILEIEMMAIEERARVHPLREALDCVTGHNPTPATITVVSTRSQDNEALYFVLEQIERKGYSAIILDTPNPGYRVMSLRSIGNYYK
jgi:hypothetical protein